ncbi:MAG TPA: biotin/lipoyl-containing protein [Candidatus Limnocylindrales bacterium]
MTEQASGSPTAEAAGSPPPEAAAEGGPADSLLGLIDRLAVLLERSDLLELEVEAGSTGLILRKPAAIAPLDAAAAVPTVARSPGPDGAAPDTGRSGATADVAEPPSNLSVVRAPLTGIFYGAPSPTSPPYVRVGGEVAVGQVIGLIEAMKLFNEIKSDQSGRVVRLVAESGTLVKAKQPLIEVEPL